MGFPTCRRIFGLLVGLFGCFAFRFLPGIVVGALVLALLLWMTGLHHMDGLLDFGDGVMVHGTPERKIEVMHDQLTGAGAIGLTYDLCRHSFGFWVLSGVDQIFLGLGFPYFASVNCGRVICQILHGCSCSGRQICP